MATLFTPWFQAEDANGLPRSGAQLFFYRAGTSTLITVYQNSSASTPHANPVVADSAGVFADIYLQSTVPVKVVLKTAEGVTVKTTDRMDPTGFTSAAYDVQVDTLADRAAYNASATGFSVLVSDVGDGRAAIYSKNSATSADWSDAAYVTGPTGATGPIGATGARGINWQGTYSGVTAYVTDDGVLDNGSSWRALQATTGNAPPTMPTTSNAYWQLIARRGVDGAGTVAGVAAGSGIAIDNTDPTTPVVSTIVSQPPGGRLTLTTGTPVPETDVASATTIYYAASSSFYVAVFDGTAFIERPIAGAQISLPLDADSGHTGYHQVSKLFDVFAFVDGGVLKLGTGPAWTSLTSRGAGAGTTELELYNSALVNKNAITLRFGAASGNTVAVAVRRASYLGTFLATADGVATDTGRLRLLFNAHNTVKRLIKADGPSANYNYSVAAYQVTGADNNTIGQVVVGLAGVMVEAEARATVSNSTSTKRLVQFKIGLDGLAASVDAFGQNMQIDTNLLNMSAKYCGFPGLGYHTIVPLQQGAGTDTQTWYGNNSDLVAGMRGSIMA